MPTQKTPKKAPLRQPTVKRTNQPAVQQSAAGWFWPVPSTRITQTYNPQHRAVDVGIPIGTPIIAPRGGKIIRARPDASGYGNLVVIQTAEGQQIYLGHLNAFSVKEGEEVKPGQLLGFSGNTGRSTGPHLHYEVRTGDYSRVDPLALDYQGNEQYPRAGSNITNVLPSTPGSLRVVSSAAPGQPQPMVSKQIPPQAEHPGLVKTILQNPPSKILKAALESKPSDIAAGIASGMNLKASNIVVAVIGVMIVGIGLTGLILGETSKVAAQPVAEAIKGALRK